MIKGLASIFGWAFLAVGVLGFIPGVTRDAMLLGIFHVNAVHNLVHVITGVAFLIASAKSQCVSMRTFQVFGILYAIMALWGLARIDAMALGPVAMNPADTVFHLFVAVIALYAGYLEPVRTKVHCPAAFHRSA